MNAKRELAALKRELRRLDKQRLILVKRIYALRCDVAGIHEGDLVQELRRARVVGARTTLRKTKDHLEVYRVHAIDFWSDDERTPWLHGQRRKADGAFEERVVRLMHWSKVTR